MRHTFHVLSIRIVRKAASLLAALWISSGCISEEAIAVDGTKRLGSDAAAGAAGTGTAGSGGAGSGGASSDGAGSGGTGAADGGTDPIWTLVLDAPDDHTTVSGIVTVKGRAPGFLNAEVWDALHKHPPLSRTAPNADGTFEMTVDTSVLSPGATSWTVFGWDSPPDQPYNHSSSVTLHLTIAER